MHFHIFRPSLNLQLVSDKNWMSGALTQISLRNVIHCAKGKIEIGSGGADLYSNMTLKGFFCVSGSGYVSQERLCCAENTLKWLSVQMGVKFIG